MIELEYLLSARRSRDEIIQTATCLAAQVTMGGRGRFPTRTSTKANEFRYHEINTCDKYV